MKKPRIEDFDPNSVPKLSSPMDSFPVISSHPFSKNIEKPLGENAQTPKGLTAQERKDETAQTSLRPTNTKVSWVPEPTDQRSLSLDEIADIKRGFRFTQDELEAVDDLKRELRRKLDLKVTQEDIVRCGVHHLIQDYADKGVDSIIVKRVKRRKVRN